MPSLELTHRSVVLFCYLQLLDALTTIAFLKRGLPEANPFVSWLVQQFGLVDGLIADKIAALAILGLVLLARRAAVLRIVNAMFAVIVAWNLIGLIRGLL